MLRLLVLGTSNSILKSGYLDGLKKAIPGVCIDNKSVGGSPGIQFGGLLNIDFSKYDFVVFDSLPNDEQYAYETVGYSYSAEQHQIIFEILSSISIKAKLIIMGFVCRNNLHKRTEIYQKRKEIAQQIQAQFIDIPEMLIEVDNQNIYNALYENHPAHPNREISYQIGAYLGEVLLNTKFPYSRKDAVDYSDNFNLIPIKEFVESCRLVTKRNSLLIEEFVSLSDNKAVKVLAPGKLLGCNINAAGTSCELVVESSDGEKQYNLYYPTFNKELMKFFVPMVCYSNVIELRVGGESVESVYPRMTKRVKEHEECSLQISSILTWSNVVSDKFIKNNPDDDKSLFFSKIILDNFKNNYSAKINFASCKLFSIRDCFDNLLAFNVELDKCVAVNKDFIFTDSVVPLVCIFVTSNIVNFFAIVEGVGMKSLSISRDGLITNSYQDDAIIGGQVVSIHHGLVTLMANGRYLCSSPSGKILFNRKVAKKWEQFTLFKFKNK